MKTKKKIIHAVTVVIPAMIIAAMQDVWYALFIQGEASVITSYSIHYTKLYEGSFSGNAFPAPR